jgi:L-rhamnose-H+ transport protein
MGITLSIGALVPMLVFNRAAVLTPNGLTVITSLAVMLAGLVVFGKAGRRKESEQSERSGAITRVSTLSFNSGLIVCILSGVFSSLINVGLALSHGLVERATAAGAGHAWAGNAVWAILFSFGALANLAYCGYLFRKNASFKLFRIELAGNFLRVAAMALMWIGSFVLYGLGAGKMGPWGLIVGWGTFLALSVLVANLWGSALGEWANTSARTRRLMASGLGILALAIVITSLGNL